MMNFSKIRVNWGPLVYWAIVLAVFVPCAIIFFNFIKFSQKTLNEILDQDDQSMEQNLTKLDLADYAVLVKKLNLSDSELTISVATSTTPTTTASTTTATIILVTTTTAPLSTTTQATPAIAATTTPTTTTATNPPIGQGDSASATGTPQVVEVPDPAATPTTENTSTPAAAPAEIGKIAIYNSTKIPRLASNLASLFQSDGITVQKVGNYSPEAATTIVRIKISLGEATQIIFDEVAKKYPDFAVEVLPEDYQYDVEIIIGGVNQ